MKTEIGAYYFPNFHIDPENERVHGRGWIEWNVGEPCTAAVAGIFRFTVWNDWTESSDKSYLKRYRIWVDNRKGINNVQI